MILLREGGNLTSASYSIMHFGAKLTSISIEQPKIISFVKTKSVKAGEMVFAFFFLNSLVFMQLEQKANYYLSITLHLCEQMEISLTVL